MKNDDRKPPAPPVMTLVPAETPARATDVLAPDHSTPPAPAEPETLLEGLRYLQRRIPGFTHLSVREKRSHSRAANLDPEFIEAGLHAAGAWADAKQYLKRSGDELREEQEEIRRWDQVVAELRVLTDGIDAANTKRKHHLGAAILLLYRILGASVESPVSTIAYMRPYYAAMKRAYLRRRQFRRRKGQEEPGDVN
jgi:hypothetical protein